MSNDYNKFVPKDHCAEFNFYIPNGGDDTPYSSNELKNIIENSIQDGTELCTIEEAECGIIAIVPVHLADIIVTALNVAAKVLEVYDTDIMKQRIFELSRQGKIT